MLNLDVVSKFLVYAKDAKKKENVFKAAGGTFLSQLLQEGNDARNALKLIRELSSSFQDLSRLAEEGYKTAHRELRQGIHSLPIEIIARIIRLATPDSSRWEREKIFLVNRYFRNVAIATPSLWTRLSNREDPQLSLERSKQSGLNIIIKVDSQYNSRLERFLSLIKPHTSRWKSFSLGVEEGQTFEPGREANIKLQLLRDGLTGHVFPMLEELQIDYSSTFSRMEWIIMSANQQDPNASLRRFFITWETPALRHLDAYGFIPIPPPSCLPTLTHFRLGLAEIFDDSLSFAQVLQSLSALEKLDLDLTTRNDNALLGEALMPVELPRLKSLHANLTFWHVRPIRSLFSNISAPNTEELQLKLFIFNCEDAARILNIIFPDDVLRWPNLKSLDYFVHAEGSDSPDYPNPTPFDAFSRLPRLHHLSINTRRFLQPNVFALHKSLEASSGNHYPPLRSLSLKNCKYFNMDFISLLRPVFESPEFETLEIVECPRIPMDLALSMLPKGKKLKYREDEYSELITILCD